jgi:thioredoxin reductase
MLTATNSLHPKEPLPLTMLETAIIGAGPYGLSIAAHLRGSGIPFRIFGRPMDSWRAHMPEGMLLKSDGFASNIDDPRGEYTLGHFCKERGIAYSDSGIPVRLETFSAYGMAFRDRMVPELEDKLVVGVERLANGFRLRLDDGETLVAKRVVLAVGITHFAYTPPNLAQLPGKFVSHSCNHYNLDPFKGRNVAVIGGGASATDLAALLNDAGAQVQLVARQPLVFHSKSMSETRTLWQQIRHPRSGLGPSLKSRFYANSPELFHYLPERLRLYIVRTHLGPAGGWFIKDKVVGRLPVWCGYTAERAEIQDGKVRLHLRSADGGEREILTEHVIAATGYKVDVERLAFLNAEIRSKIKTVEGSPVLSSNFESSMPGLYFVGIAAANSFGPVMRFAYGGAFAARQVARAIRKSFSRQPAGVADRSAVAVTE